MRHAFTLLGLMTIVVFVGGFLALSDRAEAPEEAGTGSETPMVFTLTATAFNDGEKIPVKYTCDGANVNPELRVSGIPKGTGSLVLVMDDPDIPDSVKEARGIETFDHWVLYNIPPTADVIPEGVEIGTSGRNSRGTEGYVGPCPPDREHRYIFRLYAIPGTLAFLKAPTLREVEEAARGSALAEATLTGRYERTNVIQ